MSQMIYLMQDAVSPDAQRILGLNVKRCAVMHAIFCARTCQRVRARGGVMVVVIEQSGSISRAGSREPGTHRV